MRLGGCGSEGGSIGNHLGTPKTCGCLCDRASASEREDWGYAEMSEFLGHYRAKCFVKLRYRLGRLL
jgi:hypothetical protein